MAKRSSFFILASILVALLGLPIDPASAAETENRLAANRLAANKFAANRLAANRLAANRLAANKLAANRLAANRLAANRPVEEGAFYGDVFTRDEDPIDWNACRGEGQASG